ncbi:hypothetical protein [Paenibacillus solanacearum]|uniref:hypothetical protein n=1 Tax=Paenibacillus solanacearum TaxID=2048548 RepID=UPI001C404A4D|nr:hypothetical protein [Paenibacillus solanacearum]
MNMHGVRRALALIFPISLLVAGGTACKTGGSPETSPPSTAGTFVNLGTQITRVVSTEGTVFKDSSGNVYHGVFVNGNPGKFAVLSAQTWELVKLIDVPGSASHRAILTGSDGKVYIGSAGTGELFRYTPGADRLESLGKAVAGETIIYDLTNGPDGKLYGGTYPGGKIFEYDSVRGTFKDLGVVHEGEKYARQVAYDFDENALYVGTGTACKLIRVDLTTGAKSGNLLPDSYSTMEYPNGIEIIDGKLYIQLNKSSQMVVWDKRTGNIDYTIDKASPSVVKSPVEGDRKVYLFNPGDGYLTAYDPDLKKLNTIVRVGGYNGWKAAEFVKLPGSTNDTLVAWMGYSGAMRYDMQAGKLEARSLQVPGQPIEIRSIKGGPDGKVYTSGIQGGSGVYDPNTGVTVAGPNLSQAEGIGSLGGSLYFGMYPSARVSVLDTTRSWGASNPKEVFKLPAADLQDRPFAVLGVEAHRKLFVGTVAQYGQQAGALAIYDTGSGRLQTMRDVVRHQSVVSLAYLNGKVYGGTTIWGAYGAPNPTETEGKLFAWDVASGKKEFELAPVPGKKGVTGLLAGPDGMLWGFAEGNLFVFDPAKQSVIYTAAIMEASYSGTTWTDAYMELGNDGNVYGTARGQFFAVDAKTKQVTLLDTARKFSNLAQDDYGNLYLRSGVKEQSHELWKYSSPALQVKPVSAELALSSDTIRPSDKAKVRVQKLLLEKGKSTANTAGAVIRYTSSRPEVASVAEDGTVTGHKAGTALIGARIELKELGAAIDAKQVTVHVAGNASSP